MSSVVDDLDLRDAAFYDGACHQVFQRLRREDPVHWSAANDMWVVTRHRDIVAISRDPRRFASRFGVLLGDRERAIGPGESILYLDPPQHARYRALVSPRFHGQRIAALEQRVRDLVRDLIEGITPGETVDVVERLAVPLPLVMIADLLGLDSRDWPKLRHWSDVAIAAAVDPAHAELDAAVEMTNYVLDAIRRRQAHPAHDVISELLSAEVDGSRLTEAELLGFCISLLVAGNETTRHLVAGGLLALATWPDQWERLCAQPQLVPFAVEELLRWVTPFVGFARTAVEDVEVGGRRLTTGDYVFLVYLSANRDEEVFGPTADALDIARAPNPHLSFGFGEHYCLGAGLARMEMRVVLEELIARFRRLDLDGTPRRVPSAFVSGFSELRMRLG